MTGFTGHSTVLKTVDDSTEPQRQQSVSESANDDLARSLALLVQNHPDLVAVIQAWPDVPQAVRAGILAMLKATGAEK